MLFTGGGGVTLGCAGACGPLPYAEVGIPCTPGRWGTAGAIAGIFGRIKCGCGPCHPTCGREHSCWNASSPYRGNSYPSSPSLHHHPCLGEWMRSGIHQIRIHAPDGDFPGGAIPIPGHRTRRHPGRVTIGHTSRGHSHGVRPRLRGFPRVRLRPLGLPFPGRGPYLLVGDTLPVPRRLPLSPLHSLRLDTDCHHSNSGRRCRRVQPMEGSQRGEARGGPRPWGRHEGAAIVGGQGPRGTWVVR